MARKPDAKHTLAMKRYKLALEADQTNRERALEDAQFAAGEQWPEEIKRERQGRPCLTINTAPTFVRQVSNEIRIKPPAIRVLPAEDGDVDGAEVREGLIRQIEAQSKAKRIYSRAIEDAARCGMAFWRVATEYADEESFDQDIFIKGIQNPMGVLFDPDMTDPMGSDARFCFVIDTMTLDGFRDTYGPDAKHGLEGDLTTEPNRALDWVNGDRVQVAEYWCVEEEAGEIVQLEDGRTVDVKEYEQIALSYQDELAAFEEAAAMGMAGEPPPPPALPMMGPDGQPRTRKVKRKKVRSYIMSGGEFLSGPHEWPGKRIPIIPVWGEEVRVGDRKVRTSLITWAKDPMRMRNYWRSQAVEQLALAPKAPWLVTPKNVDGFEDMWKAAGRGNPAVLFYNPDPVTGRPERIAPPAVQAAMLQEAAIANDDIKAVTGIFDASLGAQGNETSGKAIQARQMEGDVSTYVYLDNLLAAIEETGRIILDILPRVYDAPRQVRILGKKMEPAILRVNDGSQFDLTIGRYDCHITTGPSFTTQRQMAAEAFTQFMQSAPWAVPILAPRLIETLDLPDSKEIADELRQASQGQAQGEQQPQASPKDQAQAAKYQAEAERVQLETFALAQNMGGFPGQPMPPQSEA